MKVVKDTSDEQLLTLTREMYDCAVAGDWDRLVNLEKSRLPLFRDVFVQGVSGKVELAKELLSIDEKTKALAEAGLPALRDQILMIKNSGKANNAYQSVQGLAAGKD